MKKKKGQEEIVGFVLIVVILAIAMVIFLGIKLRNPEPSQKESEILYQFIESSMEQTTDCVIRQNSRNIDLNELIKECHSFDNNCLNGKSSCEVAEETMREITDSAWKVGPDYPYKGYELLVEYNTNSSGTEEIFNITSGNCTNNYIGNSYFIPQFPGNIVVRVKICS
ncbi:MAG: hypothetical protein AABX10_01225 [Nanoarchaeota archaeon]